MRGFFLYARLAAQSYFSFSSKNASRLGIKRLLVMTLFYLVFFPWLLTNMVCLALDRLLFGFAKIDPKPPLFIVGVPRSGTTFLYRLMSNDRERFTTMPFWELILAPSLIQKYFFAVLARIDAILFGLGGKSIRQIEKWIFQGLDGTHKTSLFEPEEDYFALIPAAACFLMVQPFPDSKEIWRLADFDNQVPESERDSIMKFYRGIIQRHLYFRGKDKVFLSKNPSFSTMIQSLRTTFPGCHIVGCLRHPLQAIPSLLNFMNDGGRIFGNQFNRMNFQDPFVSMFDTYYQTLIKYHEKDDLIISNYQELTSAPDQLVANIYRQFAFQLSADMETVLKQETEKARQYKSSHRYALSDFDLAESELAARFDYAIRYFDT